MKPEDTPQPPNDKAPQPEYPKPAVGPGTNDEGAAETEAWQRHRMQQRRPFKAPQDS